MDDVEKAARRVNRKFVRAAKVREVVELERYKEFIAEETAGKDKAFQAKVAKKAAEMRKKKAESKNKKE